MLSCLPRVAANGAALRGSLNQRLHFTSFALGMAQSHARLMCFDFLRKLSGAPTPVDPILNALADRAQRHGPLSWRVWWPYPSVADGSLGRGGVKVNSRTAPARSVGISSDTVGWMCIAC